MRRYLFYLPVILWMAVIFCASTDIGSTEHTSRIIGPLLRWLKPDISEQTIHEVRACVRKGGHLSEYGVLGILVWWARRKSRGVTGPLVIWSEAGAAICICMLYAATDEFHQMFVPTRGPSIWDVLIDTAGASAGILIIWYVLRRKRAAPAPLV